MYKLHGAHRYISYPIILATRECHQSWAFLLFSPGTAVPWPTREIHLLHRLHQSQDKCLPEFNIFYKNTSKQKLNCTKKSYRCWNMYVQSRHQSQHKCLPEFNLTKTKASNKKNLTDFENPPCPKRASVTRWLPAWVLHLLQSTLQKHKQAKAELH